MNSPWTIGRTTRDPQGWRAMLAAALVLPGAAELPSVPLATGQPTARPREVLFLGRQVTVHHVPSAFHAMMRLPWAERGLRMKFTVDLNDLNPATLGAHDALFIYGNAFYLVTPEQENAMEAYANAGGGVAAMHVACWSFPDSPKVTSIIGGAFLGHYAIQEFTQVILDVEHPILEGLGTYTSVDEPYQFKNLMPDRTILTVRTGPGPEEPMTWVRSQGQGRVFYHSGGHDARTWEQPNFQELVARGIEWVAREGDGPAVQAIDRARIGNGGAIAVRASLAGAGGEPRDALFLRRDGRWWRPVLEGETLDDLGAGMHAPDASDVLRVGGQAALPVMAMTSSYTAPGAVARWALWNGRGGLARVAGQEGGTLSWGSGYLPLAAPPAGSQPELVMNAGGMTVARVFVSRDGAPALDTALVRVAAGSAEPAVLLVEGEDPLAGGGAWTCGDLSSARLSLNGPGHLAAILPGTPAKRLMLDAGAGWSVLLAAGQGIPGLPGGTTLEDLREVRLNDAGSLAVAARINPGDGPAAVILRRPAGSGDWTIAAAEGPQPWLAAGESLVLPADGKGCLIDAGSQLWLLASILSAGETRRCLLRVPAAGPLELVCREGGLLELDGESVTISSIGGPETWSCGPSGIACGRLTVVPPAGPAREVLVRWNGRQARAVLASGRVFRGESGEFTIESFRVDGGGTAEDGKGGFLTSGGEWVATATAAGGGDRLIHGGSIADLDGDGRDDVLEEALGGDPFAPDSVPLLGIRPVAAGGVLRFLKKTGGPFTYGVETSVDLQSWQPAAAEPQPAADQTGVPAGYLRMELPLAGSAAFGRVRVGTN